MTAPDSQPELSRPWRWLKRLALAAFVVCLTLWLAHPAILRWIGQGLIYHPERVSTHVDALLVLDGKQGYARAEEWLAEDSGSSVMLYHRTPSRVVELGVLPTHYELSRQIVEELHIPADRVTELPGAAENIEDLLAKAIELQKQGTHVGLIMTEWRSALIHELLLRQDADESHHPAFVLIEDPEVHASNWWQSRHGVRQVAMFWSRLLAARMSDDTYRRELVTPDDFRRYAIAQ